MPKGIFVTGTDTGVGKTFFCATFLKFLASRGINAGYLKPFSTGCVKQGGEMISEDQIFVEEVTGLDLDPKHNTPVRFLTPSSPLCASRLEKREWQRSEVFEAFSLLLKRHELLVVEGIGGVMVPIEVNYFVLDLIGDLGLPVVVIARPSLGTINHSLLTLEALRFRGHTVLGFFTNGDLNPEDPTILTNPQIIEETSGIRYLGHIPFVPKEELASKQSQFEALYEGLLKNMQEACP